MKFEDLLETAQEYLELAERATSGPWYYDSVEGNIRLEYDETTIAQTHDGERDFPNAKADGEFIAIAPEMAELLKKMVKVLKMVEEAVNEMDVWRKVEQEPYDPDAIPKYECVFCYTEWGEKHEEWCPYARMRKALTNVE